MDSSHEGHPDDLHVLTPWLHFPLTRQEILEQIQNIPTIPPQVSMLLHTRLPDGTYTSVDDIKDAIGRG